jgi:hypothetical protein
MRDFVVQFLGATVSLCVCSGEHPSTGKSSTICLPILRASHSGVEHICVSEPIQWTDLSVWCVNALAQDPTYRSSSLFTAAAPALSSDDRSLYVPAKLCTRDEATTEDDKSREEGPPLPVSVWNLLTVLDCGMPTGSSVV